MAVVIKPGKHESWLRVMVVGKGMTKPKGDKPGQHYVDLGWVGGGDRVFVRGENDADSKALYAAVPDPGPQEYNVTCHVRKYTDRDGKTQNFSESPQFERVVQVARPAAAA